MSSRRNVDRLQQEIQELLEDLWQVPRFGGLRQGFRPHVDCYRAESPARLVVVVDLAGVDPGSVQILATERELLIAGERGRPAPECPLSYQQMEIEHGPFQRRIALSQNVDHEAATAAYERGLLTIVLPVVDRPPPPARVTIAVRVHP